MIKPASESKGLAQSKEAALALSLSELILHKRKHARCIPSQHYALRPFGVIRLIEGGSADFATNRALTQKTNASAIASIRTAGNRRIAHGFEEKNAEKKSIKEKSVKKEVPP